MSTQSTKQNISIAGLILLIIIVGVLVALSVPRFIEASNRAKAAEPPRVISSYESSQLADYVRDGRVEVTRVGELGGGTVMGGQVRVGIWRTVLVGPPVGLGVRAARYHLP